MQGLLILVSNEDWRSLQFEQFFEKYYGATIVNELHYKTILNIHENIRSKKYICFKTSEIYEKCSLLCACKILEKKRVRIDEKHNPMWFGSRWKTTQQFSSVKHFSDLICFICD